MDYHFCSLLLSTQSSEILKGLELVSREFELPVMFPVHLRTRKMAAGFEFDDIRAIEPLGFREFLQLGARRSRTRTGGREETCILLGVTLRGNTERPETVVGGVHPGYYASCYIEEWPSDKADS